MQKWQSSSTSGFLIHEEFFRFLHPSVLSHRFLQTLNSFYAVWNTHGAANKHALIYGHTHPYNVCYKHAHRHICAHMHTSKHCLSVLTSTVCRHDHKTSSATHKTVDSHDSMFLWIQNNSVIQAWVHNDQLVCWIFTFMWFLSSNVVIKDEPITRYYRGLMLFLQLPSECILCATYSSFEHLVVSSLSWVMVRKQHLRSLLSVWVHMLLCEEEAALPDNQLCS